MMRHRGNTSWPPGCGRPGGGRRGSDSQLGFGARGSRRPDQAWVAAVWAAAVAFSVACWAAVIAVIGWAA